MFTKSHLATGAAFLSMIAIAAATAVHQFGGDPATAATAAKAADVASSVTSSVTANPTATTAASPTTTSARTTAAVATGLASSSNATPSHIGSNTMPPSMGLSTAPAANSGTSATNDVRATANGPANGPANGRVASKTGTTTTTKETDSTPMHVPTLGVYAGPDSKGVAGATAFGAATGVQPKAVLDFAASDSWSNIAAPSWLISAHAGQSAQFELALPMLPDGSQYTLAACATGAYDAQWQKAATNLINQRLANTIVRPGWEFNGNWYHWSAKSDIAGFIGCFRHIVDTMRSVPGQHFRFDWNPNIGVNSFPAEQAYPGDAYVDYVGVDVYDYSWSRYPASGANLAAAREAAWNDTLNGDHGLAFWSRFAAAHHKPMALPEWGVAVRTDGHGGGDNPSFVGHIFDFMQDPANNVAYAHYFNTYSASNDHSLTAGHLPASLAEYRNRALALG